MLSQLKDKILAGGSLTEAEAYSLEQVDTDALCAAAAEVTRALHSRQFDTCSIINARSGKCSENCKWCAQSAHYHTGCDTYDIVDERECIEMAQANSRAGIKRFSLVASGRKVTGRALDGICSLFKKIQQVSDIYLCASLGLVDRDELEQLQAAGVKRYHCNLETAPSHFKTLCTTHTIDDKLRTIAIAHSLGMDVCSGGIIGMGETERQRIEFALTLRRAEPVSIPINILNPIPGTPLEAAEPLTEEQILRTVAIFRLVHPRAVLRFAGGRMKLSPDGQLKAMQAGVNGALVGDLLTTVGSGVAADKALAAKAGYDF